MAEADYTGRAIPNCKNTQGSDAHRDNPHCQIAQCKNGNRNYPDTENAYRNQPRPRDADDANAESQRRHDNPPTSVNHSDCQQTSRSITNGNYPPCPGHWYIWFKPNIDG